MLAALVLLFLLRGEGQGQGTERHWQIAMKACAMDRRNWQVEPHVRGSKGDSVF